MTFSCEHVAATQCKWHLDIDSCRIHLDYSQFIWIFASLIWFPKPNRVLFTLTEICRQDFYFILLMFFSIKRKKYLKARTSLQLIGRIQVIEFTGFLKVFFREPARHLRGIFRDTPWSFAIGAHESRHDVAFRTDDPSMGSRWCNTDDCSRSWYQRREVLQQRGYSAGAVDGREGQKRGTRFVEEAADSNPHAKSLKYKFHSFTIQANIKYITYHFSSGTKVFDFKMIIYANTFNVRGGSSDRIL